MTDFTFIAHDAAVKTKRGKVTFVRAHIMEKHHRERRAQERLIETGNVVWSHHGSIVPSQDGRFEGPRGPPKPAGKQASRANSETSSGNAIQIQAEPGTGGAEGPEDHFCERT